MLKSGMDAYGIDLSPRMVELAKTGLSRAGYAPERVLGADVTCLPFADGEFDTVISTGSLALMKTPLQRQAFGQMARVSRGDIRLLEPFEKKKGLYAGRVLAFLFDGMRPIPGSLFEDFGFKFTIEWAIFGGAFSYIHCARR